MDDFKGRLISLTILAPPQASEQHIVDTDAIDVQIACVPSQILHNGMLRPIANRLRLLRDSKSRYDTMHEEWLAAVQSVFKLVLRL